MSLSRRDDGPVVGVGRAADAVQPTGPSASGFYFQADPVEYLRVGLEWASMLRRVKRLIDGVPRPGEFCECRRCGTNVDPPGLSCPDCGSREIAHYDL